MTDETLLARTGVQPFPIVLAGPSGSGKTTIARALVARRGDLRFSVSATSRPARSAETDGVDYVFLSRSDFERLIEEGGLLEWAEVHGELYGTPASGLEKARRDGACLLLDIDVQGARQIRRLVPSAVTIFVLPPTALKVVERLVGRGTEDSRALQRRLRTAETELLGIGEFDYAVVNDDLDDCVDTIEWIIDAESQRVERDRRRIEELAAGMAEEIRRVLSDDAPNA